MYEMKFLCTISESLAVILTLYRNVGGISEHCNDIAVVEWRRMIHREGFHREIVTNGSIVYMEIERSKIATDQLLIVENFPSGMFIDPYELESKGLYKYIATDEVINIEEPAYRQHPIKVYIYVPVVDNRINIDYPIHLRYQRPKLCYSNDNNFYETVVLPSPKVYMAQKNTGYRCPETVALPCHKNSLDVCHWIPMKSQQDITLSINIPVGCVEHKIWVILLTSMVIIVMVVKVGHTITTAQKTKSD